MIPERADQKANRVRRGQAGGRPPAFDRELYKARNVVERCFNCLKQFRAIATRFDKLAAPTGGRRVTAGSQDLGVAHTDAELVELLQNAGLDDAVELLDDPAWLKWLGDNAHRYTPPS